MKLYSTHFPLPDPARPERPPVLVPEGFSWPGLFVGWLALLRPGSWLVAALAALAMLLAALLGRHLPGAWVLLPALHLVIGLFANDWWRWELGQAGFVAGPLVAGADRGAAMLRLLDRRLDLLGPAPAGAA